MDELSWPFPAMKPAADWTEFDRDCVDLMVVAHSGGHQPRADPSFTCIDLGRWPDGRSGSLVRRGTRNGREPFLGDSGRAVRLGPSYSLPHRENAYVCVRPPFRDAAYLALEWMRGRSLDSILGDFEFIGGRPSGITLRPEISSRLRAMRDDDESRHVEPTSPFSHP